MILTAVFSLARRFIVREEARCEPIRLSPVAYPNKPCQKSLTSFLYQSLADFPFLSAPDFPVGGLQDRQDPMRFPEHWQLGGRAQATLFSAGLGDVHFSLSGFRYQDYVLKTV